MTLSTSNENIKLTNTKVLAWIGQLVNKTISEGSFTPSELNVEILCFIADDKGAIKNMPQPLNYQIIQNAAERKIRKPGIRERNRFLRGFFKKVLVVLNNENILRAEEGVRYADKQLNFLFEVAVLMEWLHEDEFDSEPKDYIYTLLANHDKS